MPNGQSPQTKFKWQIPADKIYRVGPGLLYTTIQSAINAAVLDGVADGEVAVVEIYPKYLGGGGNGYDENLTLAPNVFLRAAPDFPPGTLINIAGNHTLPAMGAGAYFIAEGLWFETAGIPGPMFSFGGGGQVEFNNCDFASGAAGGSSFIESLVGGSIQLRDSNMHQGLSTGTLIVLQGDHNLDINFSQREDIQYNLEGQKILKASGGVNTLVRIQNAAINATLGTPSDVLEITDGSYALSNCVVRAVSVGGGVGVAGGGAFISIDNSNVRGRDGGIDLDDNAVLSSTNSVIGAISGAISVMTGFANWTSDYCTLSTVSDSAFILNNNAVLTARYCDIETNATAVPLIQVNSAAVQVFCRKNRMRQANTGATAKMIDTGANAATITLEDNSYQNFRSVSKIIALSDISSTAVVNVFANRERFKREGGAFTVYVGDNGFFTVQEAYNYINSKAVALKALGIVRFVVSIAPSDYVEDVTVSLNGFNGSVLQFLGEIPMGAQKDNGFGGPRIFGKFAIANTSGSFVECQLENLFLAGALNKDLLDVSSTSSTHIKLFNCYVIKTDNDSFALIKTNLVNGNLFLFKSRFTRTGSNSGYGIQHITGYLEAWDCVLQLSALSVSPTATFIPYISPIGNPPPTFAVYPNDAQFRNCRINADGYHAFYMNVNTAVLVYQCEIGSGTTVGEVFYYAGAGARVISEYSSYFGGPISNGVGGLTLLRAQLLARDGVQATQTFNVTGNVYPVGSGININGVNFINGVDFVVAGSAAATAQNIVNAINNSGAAGVQGVSAMLSGTTITIYSVNASAASNAITTALVGAPPITVGGATLVGGINGVGGAFQYSFMTLVQMPSIQNTLTLTAFQTVPNPV